MARQRWKDKLRPASFRGLQFFIDSSEFTTGRRGTSHEFPGRDEPYREDLGRRSRSYTVAGYVLGSNYLADKKKLVEAAEKEGSGELVHPYYGRVVVNCDILGVSESSQEGGFAKLAFQFVEAGELKYPTGASDASQGLLSSAAALQEQASSTFGSVFSIAGQAQYVVDSAADKIEDFCDTLIGYTSGISKSANDLALLAFSIRRIKGSVKDLLRTPGILAEQMTNAMEQLKKALDPSDVLEVARSMFHFGDDDPAISRTTSSREKQDDNNQVINAFVQIIVAVAASESVTEVTYPSAQEATTALEEIAAVVDTRAEDETTISIASNPSEPTETDQVIPLTDDATFDALQEMKTSISKVVLAVASGSTTAAEGSNSNASAVSGTSIAAAVNSGQGLAQVTEYTPGTTVPLLVLTYELYGSLSLQDDVIARNEIRHPGFIPGGVELEVLSG